MLDVGRSSFKYEKHPFKTFIGRIAHGFDFVGYRFTTGSAHGVEVAWRTLSNHLEKVARLYEQGADAERIGQYIKGWWQWVRAGGDLLGTFGMNIKMYWHHLVKRLGRCVAWPGYIRSTLMLRMHM